jgi:hypothetical protein
MAESNLLEKANPGLGTIKSLDILKGKVEKPRQTASGQESCYKRLQRKGNNIEAWLTFEQLNNTETFDLAALKPNTGRRARPRLNHRPYMRNCHIYGA